MDALSLDDRAALLALARASITAKFANTWSVDPPQPQSSPALRHARSSFVTLLLRGELRGCCGSLDASRSLYVDVWRNAVAAAFGDPRFPMLTQLEWPLCALHISALTDPEPLQVESEQALITSLRPHIDGLVLELPHAVRTNSSYVPAGRATFLPAVWDQLADPQAFVHQLKRKAGWPVDFWSKDIQVSRYIAEEWGEADR